MIVDGRKKRGRPKKRWVDCVNKAMRIKVVSANMMADRRLWKVKKCCADPT